MERTRAPFATAPLRLLLLACVVLPCILFAYVAWASFQRANTAKDQRLEATLDVVQEHVLKVLQTTDRLLFEADRLLRPYPDEELRSREGEFHAEFRDLQAALPEVEAIWAFDADGHPLASGTILPVPRSLNNSDRDYFKAHALEPGAGLFLGQNVAARIGNLTFFVVSRRRIASGGRFAGVVALTLVPDSLNAFYEKLTRGTPVAAGLLRTDGRLLARYPPPPGGFVDAKANDSFRDAVTRSSDAGVYRTVSGIDGAERWIAYRKVPGYPAYVSATYDVATFRRNYLEGLLTDLAIGLPISVVLVLISWLALRRTQTSLQQYELRTQAEGALKEAQRLETLGQLTGGVAHDFNNLLMIVGGNAERIGRGIPPDRQQRAVQAILDAVRTGERLTRQLLTFSRRQRVSPETILLQEKLPAIQEMLRSSLRGDIRVVVEVAPETWPVRVDVAEFELAMLNLAINARDAMPGSGVLLLKAGNLAATEGPAGITGEFVGISVRDTGAGIRPENLPKVFDPFFTTKPVGKGTGLGLSQVHGFASQAGGTATIESNLGQGTTVSIFLPRVLEGLGPPAPKATVPLPVPRKGKALLVEDNLSVAEVAIENLGHCGFEVTHLSDATAGIEFAERAIDLDIVVSDIVMPGHCTGLDLARRLRDSRPDLRILLVTGYSEAALNAASEGFQILGKPYSIVDLEEAIRSRRSEVPGPSQAARASAS